jgi:3'-phosphoadenosine 5'-phosphosulfate sulfotransferase (PAPS reductase)/FAD synthetase
MQYHELNDLQRRPLSAKIEEARRIIAESLGHSKPAVAFSGGKDSLVLLALIMEQAPDLPVIFGDTGVEFPESRRFVYALAKDWGFNLHTARPGRTEAEGYKYDAQRRIWSELIERKQIKKVLKPDGKLKGARSLERACPDDLKAELSGQKWKAGTRKGFFWCADQYGWPILGKAWSKLEARRICIDTFLRFGESRTQNPKLIEYYRVLKEAKISQRCCFELKKAPSQALQATLGVDLIFKGLMAAESRNRALNFLSRGFLFAGKKAKHLDGGRLWHSQPLATWTDADIWEFILSRNLPYSSLYDLAYVGEDGIRRNVKRNGCMFCATDFQFKSNHLFALRQTHPKAWDAIIRRGMGAEILKLQNVFKERGQQSLWENFGVGELAEKAPCVFDAIRA